MAATHVIFACDESGAKGYADQVESCPGELGVFAGILIPQEVDAAVRPQFQAIYDRYKPETGKLHIADLPPEKQEALRQDVYSAIRELNLPCFWYAIHVDGLNNWYITHKQLKEDAKQTALNTSEQPPRVKLNSPRDDRESMHEELFVGLYAHLIAFLEERHQKEVSIEVRTDQIDSPIVKNFENLAKDLLNIDPLRITVTGFDTKTEQPVKRDIVMSVTIPTSLNINVVVRNLSINTVREGDGYVLAADVLANSLNYHFKHRDQSELYEPLNTPEAIINHPLANHLAAFNDWGSGDLIGDRLYGHPNSQNSENTELKELDMTDSSKVLMHDENPSQKLRTGWRKHNIQSANEALTESQTQEKGTAITELQAHKPCPKCGGATHIAFCLHPGTGFMQHDDGKCMFRGPEVKALTDMLESDIKCRAIEAWNNQPVVEAS